jgi:CheY-like chemotaxis protein
MRNDKPVLLVEDDMIDTMTVKRAFKELQVDTPLVTAENGEEAMQYLEKSQDVPGLILLDLNMPIMNGVEFLGRVKSNPDLRRIPIVVLTTSNEMEDRQKCFGHSVAGYMTKPVSYPNFKEMMRTIDRYWTFSETA